jgi:hypothetical protein
MALVDPKLLRGIPDLNIAETAYNGSDPEWKADYIRRFQQCLLDRGASPTDAEAVGAHIHQRDYPVSRTELRTIFEQAGLSIRILNYDDTDAPLHDTMAMPVGSLSSGN